MQILNKDQVVQYVGVLDVALPSGPTRCAGSRQAGGRVLMKCSVAVCLNSPKIQQEAKGN